MRPELPTASVGSSQAPTDAVDNSAPVQPARCLFISWGKTVQTSGATSLLSGSVQVNDAYLGGKRSGGKPGSGSENKVPWLEAVSMNGIGQPIRLKLDMDSRFTSEAIAKWPKASLIAKTMVTSDGLRCFAAATEAGRIHMPRVMVERLGALGFGAVVAQKLRDRHAGLGLDLVAGAQDSPSSGELRLRAQWLNGLAC